MKKLITRSLLILALGSCTIQKRLHTGGYYIDFHSKYQSSDKNNVKHDLLIKDKEGNQSSLDETIMKEENSTIHLAEALPKVQTDSNQIKLIGTKTVENKIVNEISQPGIQKSLKFSPLKYDKKVSQKKRYSSYNSGGWQAEYSYLIVLVVLILVLILCLNYPSFAVVLGITFFIAVGIGMICLLVWLFAHVLHIEWFWTGR